ncbi:MAG TPA: dienelactone hydrolase family protein [Alphaproteobacteria bacterium]|nr:dienelactone hydrolase family protein [Alphaproteobacteria bacterium]
MNKNILMTILFLGILLTFTGCETSTTIDNTETINTGNTDSQTGTTGPADTGNGAAVNTDTGSMQYEVESSDVEYFNGVNGFYAHPSVDGNYPGVIMIHEWWGLNAEIKAYAEKLAAEGYNVLAVDLYNGKVAATSDEARNYSRSINQTQAIENMNTAFNYLKDRDSTTVGSLGWCFGGGQSMQLALNNENLDATVIYYGTLVTDESQLEKIEWPVLGVFGDKDTSIPVDKVVEFEEALNDAGVENEIYIYPGVGHAFANPTGQNYAPQETQDAWSKTLNFLDRNLK